VIGVGNPWRRDDAAGLVVARRLRETLPTEVEVREKAGEPTALIDAFDGADVLWLVDAVSSGAEPGTVHRVDAAERPLPAELFRTSTHHFGLAEAVELARALGRLPRTAVVLGIEGASFEAGEGLSPPVEAAVERVAEQVRKEVAACTRRP
jgi:hydrogenase maturation protease